LEFVTIQQEVKNRQFALNCNCSAALQVSTLTGINSDFEQPGKSYSVPMFFGLIVYRWGAAE